MLELLVPGTELYNEVTGEFCYTKDYTLHLEHSLISLSKWESKWKIPFLDTGDQQTREQTIDYIRCMTLNPPRDPFVYNTIGPKELKKVREYIADRHTATTINKGKKKGEHRPPPRERVTSELIYYWMISCGIPFEAQKWNLNRLLTLIEVCDWKNQTPKKRSAKEIATERMALNMARRNKMNSKG